MKTWEQARFARSKHNNVMVITESTYVRYRNGEWHETMEHLGDDGTYWHPVTLTGMCRRRRDLIWNSHSEVLK